MTGEEHNKYLAYSFLAHGAFQLFWMMAMSVFFVVLVSALPKQPGHGNAPSSVYLFFIGFIVVIQLLFAAPSFVAGYALLKRKRWARIAGIIGAVLAGPNYPVGTAVCIYALWFLMSDRGKSLYDNQHTTSQDYFPPRSWQGYPPPSLWADRPGEEDDWRK